MTFEKSARRIRRHASSQPATQKTAGFVIAGGVFLRARAFASKGAVRLGSCEPSINPDRDPFLLMPSFKEQSFQDRAAASAKAKQAALEKLRAKPPVDEAVVAERLAAAQAREEAKLKAAAEKRAAREQAAADKLARAEAAKAAAEAEEAAAAAAAEEAAKASAVSDAMKKALRDARYAARKARAKR